ncbi:hypothetical protein CYMTET_44057 [Cymbomonas tetramitiformis]|uniref:CYTH domain-containing protein n=1 Tax=Cymbomonas tetramitiformis TaxID=36881 RepID=A0AAE0C2V9_9CHLO|nr:hypothetical protein CYMTET_44057 [Cymbomonas tetramitiformis]
MSFRASKLGKFPRNESFESSNKLRAKMEDPAKPELLSDDKGLYAVIRKIQELKKHAYHGPDHGHAVLVAVAGPSGVGKTYFVKRIAGIIPSVCISLDQYVNTNSEQSKSADDPTNFDYDLLFQNLSGLKYGQDVWAPRYNFKTNQRDGFYKILSKNSKVVVVEGTFVLNERVRHLFDLRVGVSGGVHSDLVKRIMRDTQTTSAMRDKNSSEIIARISETVFPMYNEYFKPQLDSVHIHVRNDSSPFSGFLTNATYTLKSCKEVPTKEVEAYLATIGDGKWDHHASIETGDIYLLPPGEDQETCRNWIRMRLRHGSYSLVFEEYISDGPMLISPSMSFEVSLQVLQGLMTLGYVVGATIKRVSHVYVTSKAVSSSSKRLSIKYDDIGVLGRSFIQIESKDRLAVEEAGRALQMEGTFVPQSYIELVPTLSPDVIEPCLGDAEAMRGRSGRASSSAPILLPGWSMCILKVAGSCVSCLPWELQLERLNREWVHDVQELNKLAKENPEIVFSPPSRVGLPSYDKRKGRGDGGKDGEKDGDLSCDDAASFGVGIRVER